MLVFYPCFSAVVGFLAGTAGTGLEVVADDGVDENEGWVGMVNKSGPEAAPPPLLAVARPVDAENVRPPMIPGAFGPKKYGSAIALLLNPK